MPIFTPISPQGRSTKWLLVYWDQTTPKRECSPAKPWKPRDIMGKCRKPRRTTCEQNCPHWRSSFSPICSIPVSLEHFRNDVLYQFGRVFSHMPLTSITKAQLIIVFPLLPENERVIPFILTLFFYPKSGCCWTRLFRSPSFKGNPDSIE